MKFQSLLTAFLAATALLSTACADEEYGTLETRANENCPAGWYGGNIAILCAPGYELTTETFGQNTCSSCQPIDEATCNGTWANPAAILCAPGYELQLNQDGTCGRCKKADTPANAECQVDADCMVTGCSGQLCEAQDVATTCEFRPEYACYGSASCGCNNGSCGWAQTPELEACLAEAGTAHVEDVEFTELSNGVVVAEAKQQIACGGFAGLACPDNMTCVDDPTDDCDPDLGGADCIGVCKKGGGNGGNGGNGGGGRCKYDNKDKYWVAKDAETCAAIRFVCEDGYTPFFSECGCGCAI